MPFPALWLSTKRNEALFQLDGSPRPEVNPYTSLFLNYLRHPHSPLIVKLALFSFLFSTTMLTRNSIVPTHLKSIVSCTAVAHGGKREWEFAYFKFNKSNIATEKDDMLEAMSCSNQAWIIKRFSRYVIILPLFSLFLLFSLSYKRMLEWTLNGPLAKTDAINLIGNLKKIINIIIISLIYYYYSY